MIRNYGRGFRVSPERMVEFKLGKDTLNDLTEALTGWLNFWQDGDGEFLITAKMRCYNPEHHHEGEEGNANQERGTETVDVEEQAGDGGEVGGGDAAGEETAGEGEAEEEEAVTETGLGENS